MRSKITLNIVLDEKLLIFFNVSSSFSWADKTLSADTFEVFFYCIGANCQALRPFWSLIFDLWKNGLILKSPRGKRFLVSNERYGQYKTFTPVLWHWFCPNWKLSTILLFYHCIYKVADNFSVYMSVLLSVGPSLLSGFMSVCLSVAMSVFLPVRLSFCLYVCPFFCLSVCLSFCLSFLLSVHLSVLLSICLSVLLNYIFVKLSKTDTKHIRSTSQIFMF